MKNFYTDKLLMLTLAAIITVSCDNSVSNDDTVDLNEPASYTFTRDGDSTVSYSGQTTRIKMADELFVSMLEFDNATEESLLEMYRNQTEDGGNTDPYSDAGLNAADKNIKSKVAASSDYFSANASLSADIKNDFETWIKAQVNEVFPNQNELAEPGKAGQIADGSNTRYISGEGLEYDQLLNKSLIGALMADQILNNYLSESVLDAGSNREDNAAGQTEDGADYTTMEHKWDEAYGYIYGTSADPENPNATIGQDDRFLNKYTGQVSEDEDFSSIADDIYNAFKKGRAAIVAGEYEVRDEQVSIIRESISTVIAVRGVYYLQAGKKMIGDENYGSAFHTLSEGFGFIYSLQFTRIPETDQPYLTHDEVKGLLDDLLGDGDHGLWDLTPETLDSISDEIASRFDFTVEQAASN
ncbi:MAG: DUF4856 domain-containing protein [Balneolales bacterium]